MSSGSVLESLGKTPIPGANPAGEDIRLSDDYQEIQTEIDKLSAILGPGDGVNWSQIASVGEKILTNQSKDLMVAAYLSLALVETGTVQILGSVAGFLADLLENYWDTLFPPPARLKARKNTVEWWRDKTLQWLSKSSSTVSEGDRDIILANLDRLNKVFDSHDLCSLHKIISFIQNIPPEATSASVSGVPADSASGSAADSGQRDSAPPPQDMTSGPSKQVGSSANSEAPSGAGAGSGQPATASTDSLGASQALPPKDIDSALNNVVEASEAYLNFAGDSQWSNPWFWKISRLRLWVKVNGSPPAEGVTTMIPGPPADILTSLRAGLTNGTPKIALANAEQSIRIYIFWFDLQKIAYEALIALGFSDCAYVVLSQTAEITHRWPLITSLSFNDGTPFASSETIQWLKSASTVPQSADSGAQEALSPADLADPAQALSKLSSPSGRLGDGRSKFIKRLAEIQLWRLNGNVQTAAGLADYLIGEIDSFGLESFEPNLAVQGFKAAYEAYQSAGPQYIDQARKVAVRLALLSPLEALTLKPITTTYP